MIADAILSADERKFVFLPHEFRLDAPGESPLAVMMSSTVTQKNDLFDVKWVQNPLDSGVATAEKFLDDIVARSRRDVDRFPESAQVRANYGIALLNRGRLDDAASEFITALKNSPGHFISLANLARIRTFQGRFEEAEKLYEELSTNHPEDVAPLVNLAYLALRSEGFERAVHILEKAISVDSAATLPHYLMAIALLKLGKPQEAIGHLRVVVKSEVRSPAIYQALGVAYLMAKDVKGAVRSFKTALALAPEMEEAVHALSYVLLAQCEIQALVEFLTPYLERSPQDNIARELLAEAYLEDGKYPLARTHFLAALRSIQGTGPRDGAHKTQLLNNVGVCFDYQGDYVQSANWFLRAIEVDPGFEIVPRLNLAKLRIREGRLEQARQILQSCKERAPNEHETAPVQALVLEKQGRHDEAIQLLVEEIRTGRATWKAYAFVGGLLGDVKRDWEGACKVLQQGLQRYPDSIVLKNNLAYTFLMNGQTAEGRQLLESLARSGKRIRPQDELYITATWGLLFLWEGNIEHGRDLYIKAGWAADELGRAEIESHVQQKMHLELARAFFRRGDIGEAREEISRGLAVRGGREAYEQELINFRDTLESLPPAGSPG
jgi:tetratricopeptide (TPR) repeat protein